MRSINIHEAKTHFSRLVDEVAAGEEIIIAKAGRPTVRLVPLEAALDRPKSLIGFLAGRLEVPDDFDRLGDEQLVSLFEAP